MARLRDTLVRISEIGRIDDKNWPFVIVFAEVEGNRKFSLEINDGRCAFLLNNFILTPEKFRSRIIHGHFLDFLKAAQEKILKVVLDMVERDQGPTMIGFVYSTEKSSPEKLILREMHPGDALALAVLAQAPLYLNGDLAKSLSRPPEDKWLRDSPVPGWVM